jgi:cyclase
MLKKRLIFTLLLHDGIIQLSRNFSLQAVGNLDWLYSYYDFDSMAYSIDELVLLNVSRTLKNIDEFSANVSSISKKCFMPIAAGGGISCIDDAYKILDAGADKLIVNTALYENPKLVVEMVRIFGSQCIVASIDYKYTNSLDEVFTSNGIRRTGLTVEGAISNAEQLRVGEIYLTSMERDGTGQGYDLAMLSHVVDLCQVPIIASGGVGDVEHFVKGMQIENVTGASTANIFNFVGDGLTEARNHIGQCKIELAHWDFGILQN